MHDDDPDLIDTPEACREYGGSKPIDPSTLYRGVKTGRYSKPMKISAKAVRWSRRNIRSDIVRMNSDTK